MSEADFKMLVAGFERLRQECDTPEKATAQLLKEGLIDEDGRLAAIYRGEDTADWQ